MRNIPIGLFAGAIICTMVLQPWPSAFANNEKVLYSFCTRQSCADGKSPSASLIDVKGIIYGTTGIGGNGNCEGNGCGVAFSLNPKLGVEKVLYTFCSQQNCSDGAAPSGLIDVSGTLYGTTADGGANCDEGYDCGTVFALDPNTGAEQVVYSFCSKQNCSDGDDPDSGVIYVNGTLYGTTQGGGTGCYDGVCGNGTVFSLDPNTGAESVLYSFCSEPNCIDGGNPIGVIAVSGTLYGVSRAGGTYGEGTVFSLDADTGTENVIYSFCGEPNCIDGSVPLGVIAVNGALYGTTMRGGTNCIQDGGCGTVFSLDPNTGGETVLYSFCSHEKLSVCTDGKYPYAGLTNLNETLYGTTALGGYGTAADGTVFALEAKTGAEKVLYSFCSTGYPICTDGGYPEAAVALAKDSLYGTTSRGGASGAGAVFAVSRKPGSSPRRITRGVQDTRVHQ